MAKVFRLSIFIFISLFKNKILIDELAIIKIPKIGKIVQIISMNWLLKLFLLLNLFFKLNFTMVNKIIIILIIKIRMKLFNIVILYKLIEYGFWKFKFIHDII